MKMHRYIIILAALLMAMMTACTSEDIQTSGTGGLYLEMNTATDGVVTRAHWADGAAMDGSEQATFNWDASENEITTVLANKTTGNYLRWGDAKAYYSYTKVIPNTPATSARLITCQGISDDDRSMVSPDGGDRIYCVSPMVVDNGSAIDAGQTVVTASLPMPGIFNQSGSGLEGEIFKRYAYIYAETEVHVASATALTGKAVEFKAAAAILRFNVTNLMDVAVELNSVGIATADGSRVFPDKMTWTAGAEVPMSPSADNVGYSSVKASLQNEATLMKSSPRMCYAYVFPSSLADKTVVISVETNYLTYELKLQTPSQLATLSAGNMYTFNITLNEKTIELSTIEIASCQTYDVNTEKESLEVVENVDQWQEQNLIAQNISFVDLGIRKTIEGKEYKVLWATCNLGANISTATGRFYQWGALRQYISAIGSEYYTEDEDVQGSERDMVLNTYGNAYYKWRLPSEDDWTALVACCAQTYAAIKTDDFDASMWRFRRNIGTKVFSDELTQKGYSLNCDEPFKEQRIYFPVTGYYILDGGEKIFKSVTECHYWTSTPVAGGISAKSFGTTRIEGQWVDVEGTPTWQEGTNTPFCSMTEKREMGYAIRPILLLPVNE